MVSNLFAVVAVSLAGCKDEPVAHVWYVNVGIYEPVAYFFKKPFYGWYITPAGSRPIRSSCTARKRILINPQR
jgi:hypothetical protein